MVFPISNHHFANLAILRSKKTITNIFYKGEIIMKLIKFVEVDHKTLNSHGTDFWTGVGIGAGLIAAGVGLAALT